MRIGYLDSARGMAILLMVIGHALGMCCETSLSTNILRYIYSFHMPLFFIIYGFLYEPVGKSISRTIKKRATRYLIPYFFWGGVYANVGIFEKIRLLSYASHQSIEKAGSVTALWFLPTFFVAALIHGVVAAYVKSRKLSLITAGLLALIAYLLPKFGNGWPWGFNISIIGVVFMLAGSLMKEFVAQKSDKFLFFTAVCASFILLLSLLNGEVNISEAVYGNHYLLFLMLSIIGSYSCICYKKVMTGKPYRLFMLTKKLGQCSLGILCLHRPVLWLCREAFNKAGFEISVVVAFIIAVIATVIAYYGAKIIQKVLPEVV